MRGATAGGAERGAAELSLSHGASLSWWRAAVEQVAQGP
jgi:hypothetical protein